MSTGSAGCLASCLGAGAQTLAHRVILIVTATEGALLPSAVIALVALATALLKAWSAATLTNLSAVAGRVH